ncbi:MAG: carboxypeptidase regulatory-like domain-containing protein [Polyangiaceae bacterium]|nr:carboxypeptidase regulatory-like domain-containing protein [Polyangiaceae bacterium]
MSRRAACVAGALLALTAGCERSRPRTDAPPTLTVIPPPSASVDVPVAPPVTPEQIAASNNPSGLPAYGGPFGAIEGTITYKGPAPEAEPQELPIPRRCARAADMYAKRFRVAANGALGDAVVAATGFERYVEPAAEAVTTKIEGCAYSSRTLVLTFGQRLDIVNQDDQPYVPHLWGAPARALMVAVPHGAPVKLYPSTIGRFKLADDMRRTWMEAELLVLKFPTHAVTDGAGRYRIERVPPGEARVGAWHPKLGASLAPQATRDVKVVAGQTTKLDLEIAIAPSPSASASAKRP